MIYDEKKHYELVFSENQTVGFSPRFAQEYNIKRNEQAYAAANGKPNVVVNNLKEFGLSCLLLFIAFVTGCALRFLLPCGNSVIFHMVASAALVIAGIVRIKTLTKYPHLGFKDALSDYICGTLFIAEALAVLVMWFNLPFATDWECNFFMAGTFFIVIGLVFIIDLVMRFTLKSRLYTVEVDAACIGYVRRKSVSHAEDTTRIRWYNSPVFRYNAGGRDIVAFYDTLSRGIDSKIPMGPCTIHVNKDNQGAVYNPSKSGVVSSVILGAVLLLVGVMLIKGVLAGGVDGSSISF